MNIDPVNSANHLYSKNAEARNSNPAADAAKASKPAAFGGADKLELNALEQLRGESEIRPEVVAKGKELLNDPNFPSKEMVDSMAKLIVPFADDE